MHLPPHPEVCSPRPIPQPSLGSTDTNSTLTPGFSGSKYERNLPAPILERELALYPCGAVEADLAVAPPPLKY